MNFPLNGEVVAITGACGGFDAALSAALNQHDAKLALLDINEAGLREQLKHYPDTLCAKSWHADVCNVNYS